jgi:LDH2 family malate/lactate/ureidoglycolate dehydrogenase
MLERFLVPEEDRVYVAHDRMHAATKAIFTKMGLSDDDATVSADVLMTSDLRGCESHGVSNMLARYVDDYSKGYMNPRPNVRVTRESHVTANLDGDIGLGLHVLPKAMDMAIEKAREHGTGTVVVHNSRHIGMLAYHAMMPIAHDMIGWCMTAGNPVHAVPTFGAEARFATNPWAWAFPADKEAPFVFDIATTQVAGNKLRLADRIGAPMEPAWITGNDGAPIMEESALPPQGQYKMLPFGGTREQGSHKGYGFAAVAEIMCDLLSGMGAGFLMPPAPPLVLGHYVQAISIDAFTDVPKFKRDMDDLLRGLRETKPAPGHDRVVYAGLPEAEETEIRMRDGIPYHREVIEWFESLRAELDLDYDLR